jgi:hypothetical protein
MLPDVSLVKPSSERKQAVISTVTMKTLNKTIEKHTRPNPVTNLQDTCSDFLQWLQADDRAIASHHHV